MALVSTTVMVLKGLLKQFSKKAIKGAIKKKVKGKVKSKIKDKLLGKKKDKRQTAKNIMQEMGEFPGGGAIVATAQPTTSLIPSGGSKGGALATIDKGGDGKKSSIDFKAMSQKIDNITEMTGAIAMLTGTTKKQAEEEVAARKEAAARRAQKKREAKLEAKKGESKVPGVVKKPAQNLLDMAIKFIVNVALGTVVLSLMSVVRNAKKIWTTFKEGFEKFFWIIRGILWKGFAFKGIGKTIKALGGSVKATGAVLTKPFDVAGKSITNIFKSAGAGITKWANNIAGGLGNIIKNIPGFKQVGNVLGKVGGGIKNVAGKIGGGIKNIATNIGGGIKNVAGKIGGGIKNVAGKIGGGIKNVAGKGFNAVKGFLGLGGKAAGKTGGKVGSKIIKGGLMKTAKRGALKLLGKGAVKTIGKVFGRIPVIGPLMVALASMLSGDPPKQTLFKAMGAALGGLAGSFIPIPILGTILGEIVGEFAGDLFYTLVSGGGVEGVVTKMREKAKKIMDGGKVVFDWTKLGFSRLMEGLPKGPIGLGKWFLFGNIIDKAKLIGKAFLSRDPMKEGAKLDKDKKAKLDKKEVKTAADDVSKDDPTQDSEGDVIVAEDPNTIPSGGGGGGGGSGGSTVVVSASTKDVLNSYNKSVVTGQLSKI